MKTWDVLDRETGRVTDTLADSGIDDALWLSDTEVAWCRETGEVVYR